jgi:hypothetical protein
MPSASIDPAESFHCQRDDTVEEDLQYATCNQKELNKILIQQEFNEQGKKCVTIDLCTCRSNSRHGANPYDA